jgi:hypothetical protein
MLISIWGLLTALVLAHMPVGQPSLRQASGLAARTALLGAPVMALLFALFPRIGPLWGVPQDGVSTTGLSNTMRMGSVTEVARDESVAMRIRFDGARPDAVADVLPRPGADPLRRPRVAADRPAVRARGRARPAARADSRSASRCATRRPSSRCASPRCRCSRRPTEIEPVEGFRFSRREDLQWLGERPIFERHPASRAEAYPRYSLGTSRRSGEIQESLELPPGFNPRTLAWARALRAEPRIAASTRPPSRVSVLRHIREGGYDYTLSPGRVRPQRDRRVLARPQDRLLRALRLGLRRRHARGGIPGAHRHRLPGLRTASRSTASSSSARARRTPGPSTGRRARAGSAPTRPGAVSPDRIGSSIRLSVQPGPRGRAPSRR